MRYQQPLRRHILTKGQRKQRKAAWVAAGSPPIYQDEFEQCVGEFLIAAGVEFKHASQVPGQRLDFYLPEHHVYIEVKKFHSPRIALQTATQEHVIVIQGGAALHFLETIFKR